MGRFEKYKIEKTGGRFAKYAPTKKKTTERKTVDISDVKKLKTEAERRGLEIKEKKPSLFRRTIDIISRPLYASAGGAKALLKKDEKVLPEMWKGFTGKEKETYSDVLAEAGVKNKYIKGVVGFALDVVLDPTTYFGGTLIKGAAKGVKAVAKPVGKGLAKVAPESALHLADASKSLKDAFGTAFKFGYGTTKGLGDDVSRAINKMGIAKEEIIEGNIKMMGKKYSKKELAEAGELMIKNRRLELQARKGIKALPKAEKEIRKAVKPITKAKELKAIPDELAVEARKFKSVEEFVEAQGKTLYHGTSEKSALKISKEGFKFGKGVAGAEQPITKRLVGDVIYFSENPKVAKSFASGRLDFLVEPKLIKIKTSNLKIAKLNDIPENLLGIERINFLKRKRFDGLKTGADDIAIWNIDKIKTKSQLTDIYNQATKAVKEVGGEVAEKIPKYATSKNSKVNELLTIFKGKAKEIAKKAGIDEATAYENYFPFLRLDKLKKVEQSSAILKESHKGYLDKFRDLIKDDNLLKKPIEAYSRREFEVVRNKIVGSTLDDMVKAYGKGAKAFKNIDEALAAGYKPIYEKGFKQMTAYPVKTAIGKTVKALGKAKPPLGYLKEADAKFIDNYLFPEFKTIDHLAKASGYDKFTRWFKTWVTAYFPAFHIRNYISGNVQNYQVIGAQAFNPKNHNTALAILMNKKTQVKLANKVFDVQDLNKVMKENFKGASRYISDIGDYVEEIMGASNKFRIKKVSNLRQVGNFIELNQKAVAMTGALRQGKTLKQAIKIAEMAGFDYSKITKFESKIMRRAVPFYTFARKNAELQLKTFAKHPERIINQAKLTNALSVVFGEKVNEKDLKGIPPWALSGLGFKVKGNKYFTQFGLPLEEFIGRINKFQMSTLQSLNPLIKYKLESKMGFDFFRERKIIDINKVAPATGKMFMEAKEKGIMPEWLDNALNIKSYVSSYDQKTKYTGSPKMLHKLRNIPTSRFQNTLEKIFNNDMDKVSKWLAFFTGARIYDIDIEQQKYFTERDLRRDIEDQLLDVGEGKKYESFYIYKD